MNQRKQRTKEPEDINIDDKNDYLSLYDLPRRRRAIGDGGFEREEETTQSLSERALFFFLFSSLCNNNTQHK